MIIAKKLGKIDNQQWVAALIIILMAETLAIIGFTSSMPIIPFYIQVKFGITNPNQVKIWNGLLNAVPTLMLDVKPLADRVLVRVELAEKKTAGGIFIPDTAQEKTQTGIVVSIGDDDSIKVAPNDKVMFNKYAGSPVKIDSVEHLILEFKDIIAIIS